MYKTTKKDFEYFKAVASIWLTDLGFHDWQVIFHHECTMNSYAECHFWDTARMAHINLAATMGEKPSLEYLAKLALHEVLELLLASLRGLSTQYDLTGDQLEQHQAREGHIVIHKLERVLGDKQKQVRKEVESKDKKAKPR